MIKAKKYSVVVMKVNNITCRTLLDFSAGNSYAPSAHPQKPNLYVVKKETKRIQIMM